MEGEHAAFSSFRGAVFGGCLDMGWTLRAELS